MRLKTQRIVRVATELLTSRPFLAAEGCLKEIRRRCVSSGAHFERDRRAKQLPEQKAEAAIEAKEEAIKREGEAVKTAEEWKAKFEALEKDLQAKKA